MEKDLSIKVITEGAISVGLAVVLGIISDLIPGFKLPNGGSFSLSMLPLFIFSLRRGATSGALVGLTYGIINFLIDGLILHWGSIFFDYLIPFSLLGLVSGLFSKKATNGLIHYSIIAVLLGGFIRYLLHSISGVIFFSDYTPEGMHAIYYSFIFYNLPYMLVSTIGSLVFVVILHKRLISLDTRIV
jgi:thiamine transporter